MKRLALTLIAAGMMPLAGFADEAARNKMEHDLLRGTWTLISIQDNGETLGSTVIRDKLVDSGRVMIGERLIRMMSPVTGDVRTYAFRLGVMSSPKTIELTNSNDDLIRGIYRFNGDNLEICVRHERDGLAPTEFASPEGSKNLLMTMHIVTSQQLTDEQDRREKEEEKDIEKKREAAHQVKQASVVQPVAAQPAAAAPQPAPAQPAPSAAPASIEPTAEQVADAKDMQIRRMLTGSWTQRDPAGTVTTVLYNDGTYTATRAWAESSNQFFSGATTSKGSWSYNRGQLVLKVSQSTDPQMTGQVITNRLHSIGDRSATYIDVLGRIQHTTRLQ